MNTCQTEQIKTLHPEHKKGILIPKSHYERIFNFIAEQLDTREEVTLTALLETAEEYFDNAPNIGWQVYHVRLDMETRGFIKLASALGNPLIKILRLTSQGIKNRRTISV